MNQKSLDKGKGIKINCPYCGKEAKWCENKEVYGKNYGKSYMCYWCKDCGAYDLAGSIEEETEDLYNFINQNYVPKVEFKQVSNPLDENYETKTI